MEEKQNAIFTIAVIAAFFVIVSIADLMFVGPLFARKESAADLSEISTESILSGEFERTYEAYTQEHFVGLEKYRNILLGWDILTQKKDFNGVYRGRRGQLFAMHTEADYGQSLQDKSIAFLQRMALEYEALIIPVPTADGLYTEKMPAYADSFSQSDYLAKVAEAVGPEHYVNAYGTLASRAEEDLYYLTDSHWTDLAAYYTYLEWQKKAGKRYTYDYDTQKMVCLNSTFRGDLWQATGFPAGQTDSIYKFTEPRYREAQEIFDRADEQNGFSMVKTGYSRWKNLLVIKDSYGDSLLPLLAPHYKEIFVIDVDQYHGDMTALMKELGQDGSLEVLVVGNIPDMIQKAGPVR